MFMACVFMLVLQAYLYQISYCHKEYQAQIAYVRARLMAEMVYQTQNQDVERVVFEEGVVTSRFNKHQHVMTVTLGQKKHYQFYYPRNTKQPSKENASRGILLPDGTLSP
ncbi:competence type IV pilus minor pilin ComGG [Streptococcus dysgalactiae]|uniref:competence type IV pilus minor pilin ComGG n=2 Tax=Streptococcus dysgalactiae TaxID=1334 RepID=UPI0039F518D6